MKTIQFFTVGMAFFAVMACNSGEQANQADAVNTTTTTTTTALIAADEIQVIQFHSEHRCMTCNAIEGHTKNTLASLGETLPFALVNVDDAVNEQIAEEFEATGTALYLYNPKTGAKQDLTDFAFMNARDSIAFQTQLAEAIAAFKMQ